MVAQSSIFLKIFDAAAVDIATSSCGCFKFGQLHDDQSREQSQSHDRDLSIKHGQTLKQWLAVLRIELT